MMAWIYAGFTEDELTAYARAVLGRAKIAERIRPEVRAIVRWARSNDVEVLVASASPRTPVVVGVEDIPIPSESVFALTTKVEAGAHQPELTGVFVYAEGKATAVSQGRPGAFVLGGFGDSAYDGALMRMSAGPRRDRPRPGPPARGALDPRPHRARHDVTSAPRRGVHRDSPVCTHGAARGPRALCPLASWRPSPSRS